ncbi:hypothetical protein [Rufibacter latericius]|uniref:Uncharacterized protein n=1 Tax=Rufibacter latericius TaxID=2487040 RepID=A0A3M9MYL1_9BACT|nr:hypothetical protein [Rufibacter latericius]RNI30629.1 hypothetical protein EFB08_05100 [Rufibacter latericius]
MTSSVNDLLFLQQLYGQDTLYVVPEEANTEAISLPKAAQAVAAQTPVALEEPVPAPVSISMETPEPLAQETASVPAIEIPAPAARREEIKWLGEAERGTYLLFDVPEEVFGRLPQHAFLQKVMAAVGLTTSQIKFGNMSRELEHDVKQIAAQNKAKHIILFGQGLPVANLSRMEFYRMYRFEESRFVLVDSLEDIEKSVELKKKLWDVLQKIFLQQN